MNPESSLTVHIGKGTIAEIVEQAGRESPLEACGLLLGWRDGNALSVTGSLQAKNVSPQPRVSYEIDPQMILKKLADDFNATPDDIKPGLIGFYHSHPNGEVKPSRRDLTEAWPDMLNLIVGTGENRNRCTFFWHNTGILYATVVDPTVTADAALTRFSQGSTITLLPGI